MKENEAVKKIIKERGWSYEKLSEEVGGKAPTTISDMLNRNKTSMRTDTFHKMTNALGYEIVLRDKMGSGKEIIIDMK